MSDTVEIVLVFAPDGKLTAAVEGGVAPEVADAAIKEFFKNLQVDKAPVAEFSEPERHAHPAPRFLTRISDRA